MRSTTVRLFQLAALAAAALAAGRAHAGNCTPARMLMVVDKSSSMTQGVDGTGKSKWTLAQEAITSVANAYENKIDLGINIFPNPSQCSPGKTIVQPGPGHAAAIISAIAGAPPAGGNYTPMSQSIDVAAAEPLLADATRRPSILLITDGWQWCDPYVNATRTWPIDSVKAARAKGINVYVVGFGSSVDVTTMNQMAWEAGTAKPGCDRTNTTITGNNCYYQADSGAALLAALNSITVTVTAEICNGLDDDCDGLVDEGLSRGCSSACGSGVELCAAGSWGGCNAPQPGTEICDGIDNDCDGTVDEGCGCTPGATTTCGIVGTGPCAKQGVQTCTTSGSWGPCLGAYVPQPEVCNGIDDDCDGIVDNGSTAPICGDGRFCGDDNMCHDNPNEIYQSMPDPCEGQGAGCVCQTGEQRACSDLKGACNVGAGVQTCGANGTWGKCRGVVGPEAETCNGIDDDCDGVVDDGDDDSLCPGGWVCGDDGRCHNNGASATAGCNVGTRDVDRTSWIFGLGLIAAGLTLLRLLTRRRAR